MAFHICTLTFHASVELVKERVVDHTEHGTFERDEPERDARVREAMDEVRRAVCGGSGNAG